MIARLCANESQGTSKTNQTLTRQRAAHRKGRALPAPPRRAGAGAKGHRAPAPPRRPAHPAAPAPPPPSTRRQGRRGRRRLPWRRRSQRCRRAAKIERCCQNFGWVPADSAVLCTLPCKRRTCQVWASGTNLLDGLLTQLVQHRRLHRLLLHHLPPQRRLRRRAHQCSRPVNWVLLQRLERTPQPPLGQPPQPPRLQRQPRPAPR